MPGDSSTVQWVDMGVLGRAHGLKGEIILRTTLDQGEILSKAQVVRVRGKRITKEYSIISVRHTNNGTLLLLDGIDDRDKAMGLTGSMLSVKRDDFPALEEDEFYYSDLEGAPVLDEEGNTIGRVLYFEEYGTDLMFFDWTGHGRVAIPVVDEYVICINRTPPSIAIRTEHLSDLLQD